MADAKDDAQKDGAQRRTHTLLDRRKLLAGGALLGSAGAAMAGGAAEVRGTTIRNGQIWRPGEADYPEDATGAKGYRFFTGAEAAFVEPASERMIPSDDLGPGAIEAGVPVFIDRQLAGPFGRGDHFYLGGPWPQGLETQGYQTRYTPADLYRAAIPAIERWVGGQFSGRGFKSLGGADQDKVLTALEGGDAKLKGVSAKAFWGLFIENVIEGFFADPIYGGNRDMVGWKLIGFPGARYDYREWVGRHSERYPLPPVGLKGRPAWDRA